MNKFILELKRKRLVQLSKIAFIMVGVFVVFFLMFFKETNVYEEFDKDRRSSKTTIQEVLFLIGPFAEFEENNVVKKRLYIAITEYDTFILSTGKNNNTGVPVLGEDITEDEIDSVQPVTIKGRGERFEYETETLLMEFYNELTGDYLELTDPHIIFGWYYLDTNNTGHNGFYTLLFLELVIGIILIICAYTTIKYNQRLMSVLKVYEENGILAECEEDFINYKNTYNKILKIVLSKRYLYCFKPDLLIIPLDEIVNVYGCCIINNEIQTFEYIAIETEYGSTYHIAPKSRERKNYIIDGFREQLKKTVKENNIYDSWL